MSHNLIVFPRGFLGKKSEFTEFIFANGPILGIAKFNFVEKGKIRNNSAIIYPALIYSRYNLFP